MPEWDDEAWDKVDAAAARFEQMWHNGETPFLADFVPPSDQPERFLILKAIVKLDMEHRWGVGESPRVEAYLADWPELSQSTATIVELLQAEFRIRALGDVPLAEEELRDRVDSLPVRIDPDVILSDAEHRGEVGLMGNAAEWNLSSASTRAGASTPGRQHVLHPGSRLETRVSEYEVKQLLGRGGMATVYLATDLKRQRAVAIKMLHLDDLDSSEVEQQLLEEMTTVAQINHPGIIPVCDFGRSQDGRCFFVMEYIEGKSLAELLKAGRIPRMKAHRFCSTSSERTSGCSRKGFCPSRHYTCKHPCDR